MSPIYQSSLEIQRKLPHNIIITQRRIPRTRLIINYASTIINYGRALIYSRRRVPINQLQISWLFFLYYNVKNTPNECDTWWWVFHVFKICSFIYRCIEGAKALVCRVILWLDHLVSSETGSYFRVLWNVWTRRTYRLQWFQMKNTIWDQCGWNKPNRFPRKSMSPVHRCELQRLSYADRWNKLECIDGIWFDNSKL